MGSVLLLEVNHDLASGVSSLRAAFLSRFRRVVQLDDSSGGFRRQRPRSDEQYDRGGYAGDRGSESSDRRRRSPE